MSSNPRNCSFCCLFMLVVTAFVLMFAGLNYHSSISYTERQCVLTGVTYPTNTPSHNDSWSNFIECDCGRRCTSDLGTCVKLFAYEENAPSLEIEGIHQIPTSEMIKLHPSSAGASRASSECTFAETQCPNGESHDDRMRAIEEAFQLGEPYRKKMLANETIPCYLNDSSDEIYLNVNKSYVLLIVVGSLSFLFLICAAGCYIEHHRENEEPCFVCGMKCSDCKSDV